MEDGSYTPPEYAVLAMGGACQTDSHSESEYAEAHSRPDSPEIELQNHWRPSSSRPKWCNIDSATCDRSVKPNLASISRQGGQESWTSRTTPSTSWQGGQESRTSKTTPSTSGKAGRKAGPPRRPPALSGKAGREARPPILPQAGVDF